MSEQKFKEAKGNLAFSQKLRDQLTQQPQAPQSDQQMPQQAPVEQQSAQLQQSAQPEAPQEEAQEQKGIIQGVVDAINPLFDKITQAISGGANGVQDDKKEAEIPAKLDSLETKVDELIATDKDVHN